MFSRGFNIFTDFRWKNKPHPSCAGFSFLFCVLVFFLSPLAAYALAAPLLPCDRRKETELNSPGPNLPKRPKVQTPKPKRSEDDVQGETQRVSQESASAFDSEESLAVLSPRGLGGWFELVWDALGRFGFKMMVCYWFSL